MTRTADIAVIGAGFAGSIMVLVLRQMGLRPVLFERGRHPRFAIGESSTPAADMVLKSLSRRYDLPELMPLTAFGSWTSTYPQLDCGLKRGFSYFHHQPHAPFVPRADHCNELLVAASSDDQHSDTHWLRADVDSFLTDCVRNRGIAYYDNAKIRMRAAEDGWQIQVRRDDEQFEQRVKFVVDASGAAACVPHALGLADASRRLKTHSRALYGHFVGVQPWSEVLNDPEHCRVHPFDCDAAALHHLLEEGWFWLLRFRSGLCSAGLVIDEGPGAVSAPARNVTERTASGRWQSVLQRYPSLEAQFRSARLVCPAALVESGRLQRCWSRAAGTNWCLLPHTFGFVDPLHSSGIAFTLCGLERAAQILGTRWGTSELESELRTYEDRLQRELTLIDRLVAGAYLARHDFELFVAFSMLYFVAAVRWEQRRFASERPGAPAGDFLCADHGPLFELVCSAYDRLESLYHNGGTASRQAAAAEPIAKWLTEQVAPLRPAALATPAVPNLYWHTAAPRDAVADDF